jgi:hypothetical protein
LSPAVGENYGGSEFFEEDKFPGSCLVLGETVCKES